MKECWINVYEYAMGYGKWFSRDEAEFQAADSFVLGKLVYRIHVRMK